MIVIGLLGRAGAGKSTAAQYLVEKYGAKTFSFAAPIKDLAKILWDFSEEQVRGTQAQKEAIDPRWGISPRTAMIRLGDGARGSLGANVWIDACFNQIKMARPRPDIAVIEDVRYPNEAQIIAHYTGAFSVGGFGRVGFVIKLVCPDSDSTGYANAPSEKSVDEVPEEFIYATIVSSKSPGSIDLKTKLDEAMQRILTGEKVL